MHLALCHTVIAEDQKDGTRVYNASSPDELALINAAKYFGFEFFALDEENNLVVHTPHGYKSCKLLNVIEFSSARKRMSVVVRMPDNVIKLLTKGADSVIM